jgi:2-methylisocitrate lyase-like PEP mutase family enzyme
MSATSRQAAKAAAFRALHEGEPFVIPNPWDAGSARVMAALGFRALASTSSGFAYTLGRLDGAVSLDEVVAHAAALDGATDLPVSIDLENGYGPDPVDVVRAITEVAGVGVVGASIEDFDRVDGLYESSFAAERIAAAHETAVDLGFPFMLTARAENHIRGNPNLDDTIMRLLAYEAAGADVLYAPGLATPDEIRAVHEAVSKPLNVLVWAGMSMTDVVDAGAQRISVGGGLTWAAVNAMVAAATSMSAGDLGGLGDSPPLEDWFA